MRYSEASIGRIYVARLEDGESIYEAVEQIADRESIKSAAVMALGGMRSGSVVTGPVNTTGEVIPHIEEFNDAREMVGFGTLFLEEGKPSFHFHAGIGRGRESLVGCPRVSMSVYLVLEVVVIELVGINACREYDLQSGLHLLSMAGCTTVKTHLDQDRGR